MENALLVHKHLIVRAEAVKPPMDEAYLTEWLNDFITSINMKVLMGPYVSIITFQVTVELQEQPLLRLLIL